MRYFSTLQNRKNIFKRRDLMKKYKLMKLALVGFSAATCISGQVARETNPEIAMTKCPEDVQKTEQKQSQPDDKAKGAAKQVVTGRLQTDGANHKKGAAQTAIETEVALQNNESSSL